MGRKRMSNVKGKRYRGGNTGGAVVQADDVSDVSDEEAEPEMDGGPDESDESDEEQEPEMDGGPDAPEEQEDESDEDE